MNFAVKTLAASACVATFAFAASSAQAESVTVGAYTHPYGLASANVTGYSGSAGEFKWNVTGSSVDSTYSIGDKILSFCVELTQFAQSNVTYEVVRTGAFTAQVYANLTKLFNKYWTAVTDKATSAAMQLAVWEIVNEAADNGLDLSKGDFKVTSAGQGAKGIAQGWLDNLDGGTGNYSIIRLVNEGTQDQVTVAVNAVPLPGAALMFLSALGLGGLARRKQRPAAEGEALAA